MEVRVWCPGCLRGALALCTQFSRYFACVWQISGFVRRYLAYTWQSVFEISHLGGNFIPSNCGLSRMTGHIYKRDASGQPSEFAIYKPVCGIALCLCNLAGTLKL